MRRKPLIRKYIDKAAIHFGPAVLLIGREAFEHEVRDLLLDYVHGQPDVHAVESEFMQNTVRIDLSRPTDEAFEILDELRHAYGCDANICYLELAHDVFVPDPWSLCELLGQHLIMRWHGKDAVLKCGRDGTWTWYWRRRRWGTRNLVVYPDNRKHDRPCAHIEMRFEGHPLIRNLLKLDTGEDFTVQIQHLRDFDHAAYWERELVLLDPDLEAVGRQMVGRGRANLPELRRYCGDLVVNLDRRRGQMAWRISGETAQGLRDFMTQARPREHQARFRPKSSMRPIALDELIARTPGRGFGRSPRCVASRSTS